MTHSTFFSPNEMKSIPAHDASVRGSVAVFNHLSQPHMPTRSTSPLLELANIHTCPN